MDVFPPLAHLVVHLTCFMPKHSQLKFVSHILQHVCLCTFMYCLTILLKQSPVVKEKHVILSQLIRSVLYQWHSCSQLFVLNLDRGCNISVHSPSTLISWAKLITALFLRRWQWPQNRPHLAVLSMTFKLASREGANTQRRQAKEEL